MKRSHLPVESSAVTTADEVAPGFEASDQELVPNVMVPPSVPPPLPRGGGRPLNLAPREQRYPEHLPAIFGEGVSLDARGLTGNVSRKGLELMGQASVAVGTHVSFVLRLRNKAFVRGVGEVMWTRSVPAGAILGVAVLVADPTYWAFLDDLRN